MAHGSRSLDGRGPPTLLTFYHWPGTPRRSVFGITLERDNEKDLTQSDSDLVIVTTDFRGRIEVTPRIGITKPPIAIAVHSSRETFRSKVLTTYHVGTAALVVQASARSPVSRLTSRRDFREEPATFQWRDSLQCVPCRRHA